PRGSAFLLYRGGVMIENYDRVVEKFRFPKTLSSTPFMKRGGVKRLFFKKLMKNRKLWGFFCGKNIFKK
ncbi:hypothetical protein, partial [Leptospira borgpetersenii]|uniref:hypothetical protein n=1 Tax=Leptospira borgpetersenii TaxID=174 RepID=UPI0027DAD88A